MILPALRLPTSPLIVALDVDNIAAAKAIVEATKNYAGGYKIGLELWNAYAGLPDLLAFIKALPHPWLLDIKLKDIGTTMAKALAALLPVLHVRATLPFGITIHADEALTPLAFNQMQTALRSFENGHHAPAPLLLGVTVLSSTPANFLKQMGMARIETSTLLRTVNARNVGIHGIVCAATQAASMRELWPEGKLLVPGCSLSGQPRDDQPNPTTYAQAYKAGATWLVLGREHPKIAEIAASLEPA
ncbi:MAG: orotidine 5'-phosphate decarboxylase / HUMPS family protein [Alphaproteobacteria bacterium]